MNHEGYQIENEIFWQGLDGGWEKVSVGLWKKLVKNSPTIFDIGANTGVFALIAKAVNPSAEVYAFEPIARIYDKLRKNIQLNNFAIKSFPVAISDKDGKAEILDNPSVENEYSLSLNNDHNSKSAEQIKVEIDIITLDTFIEQNNINKIDLLKIDVESHEGEVMEGFAKHLPLFKPTLLIEILRNPVGEKVQRTLTGLNYLYFNIDENGEILKVENITRRGNNYNYLICQPAIAAQLGLI
jgi:FkbM family methyltransferase